MGGLSAPPARPGSPLGRRSRLPRPGRREGSRLSPPALPLGSRGQAGVAGAWPRRHFVRAPCPPAGGGAGHGARAACPFKAAGGCLSVKARRALPLAAAPRAARWPAPIYNGVYQHFLKGAAARLNHTTASGQPRPSRLEARVLSFYWLKGRSIRSHPAPSARMSPSIGCAACRSIFAPRAVRPRDWWNDLPLIHPPTPSPPCTPISIRTRASGAL